MHEKKLNYYRLEGVVGEYNISNEIEVYLDKLLEYCCRETMRIEWDNEEKRRECAEFILERVISLYIKVSFIPRFLICSYPHLSYFHNTYRAHRAILKTERTLV